jgi:hypothetical protein
MTAEQQILLGSLHSLLVSIFLRLLNAPLGDRDPSWIYYICSICVMIWIIQLGETEQWRKSFWIILPFEEKIVRVNSKNRTP